MNEIHGFSVGRLMFDKKLPHVFIRRGKNWHALRFNSEGSSSLIEEIAGYFGEGFSFCHLAELLFNFEITLEHLMQDSPGKVLAVMADLQAKALSDARNKGTVGKRIMGSLSSLINGISDSELSELKSVLENTVAELKNYPLFVE